MEDAKKKKELLSELDRIDSGQARSEIINELAKIDDDLANSKSSAKRKKYKIKKRKIGRQ